MASKTKQKTRSKGTGTIYKDRNRFYFKVRINGKAKTTLLRNADDTPCTNVPDAEKAAERLRPILLASTKEEIALHIADAKKIKKRSGLLLSNVWHTFVKSPSRPDCKDTTLNNHSNSWEYFLRWVTAKHPEATRAAEIDVDIAKEYFADQMSRGLSGRTFNFYLASLRLVYQNIMEQGAIDENPFLSVVKRVEETQARREFTAEQVASIFEGFDTGFYYDTTFEVLGTGRTRVKREKHLEYVPMHKEQMKVLLNLCCWTGCRGQDGCLMTWDAIDFKNNRITYIPIKTARKTRQRGVTLPLHPNLRAALIDALQWRNTNRPDEDYVIPAVAERYNRNATGVQKDVMKIIRCATGLETTVKAKGERRKYKVNAYSLHSFRHTFVSFCANAGVPLAIVAEIVGHGNPAMTRHYSHISDVAKSEAINALPVFAVNVPVSSEDIIDVVPIREQLATSEPERRALHDHADSLPIETINQILDYIATRTHEGKQ